MSTDRQLAMVNGLIANGLNGLEQEEQLRRFCEALLEAGIPVNRAAAGCGGLHPVVGGYNSEWSRDGTVFDPWNRGVRSDEEINLYPFGFMLRNRVPRLRQRLTAADPPSRFPLLQRLRAGGTTDYLGLLSPGSGRAAGREDQTGGGTPGSGAGWLDIALSLSTDQAGGFTDGQLAFVESVAPVLFLGLRSSAACRAAATALETYLGADAGRQVLEGAVMRGSTRTIGAVLLYADFAGFTKIADSRPAAELTDMLNTYFGCLVAAVHEQGGQVLKFIGDGLLAIFRLEADRHVCSSAIATTDKALAEIAAINAGRAARGEPFMRLKIGLHLGDVLYGNIGGVDRLDFTVIGPAVNEAARIVGMCGPVDREVLMSSTFVDAAGDCDGRVLPLGRHALRGVRRPQALFTLDTDSGPETSGRDGDNRGREPGRGGESGARPA